MGKLMIKADVIPFLAIILQTMHDHISYPGGMVNRQSHWKISVCTQNLHLEKNLTCMVLKLVVYV